MTNQRPTSWDGDYGKRCQNSWPVGRLSVTPVEAGVGWCHRSVLHVSAGVKIFWGHLSPCVSVRRCAIDTLEILLQHTSHELGWRGRGVGG